MGARSYFRGHEIIVVGNSWLYKDNNMPVETEQRKCGYCGNDDRNEKGHDKCIENLRGVANACCGHGKPDEAYIQYCNGDILRGEKAIEKIKQLRLKESVHD